MKPSKPPSLQDLRWTKKYRSYIKQIVRSFSPRHRLHKDYKLEINAKTK